jgi:cytochrome c peroxidase
LVFDAIAEFEKALITPNSKFDLYLKGKAKLSKKEKEGFLLFKRYGCITCHNGINLGGNSYQKIGVVIKVYKMPRGLDRYEVTKNPDDKYVYKVPTLRNIALTYPYFHNGSVKTLKEAIKLMGYYNLGIYLRDDEIDKIEAFLKTLTGKKPKILDEK